MTDLDRFMAFVIWNGDEDECWTWGGSTDRHGYGQFRVGGRVVRAHRFAYEIFVGPVPEGLDLDHDCHNRDPFCLGGPTCIHRPCANFTHLEPATRRENTGRGSGKRYVTHCPAGHPYNGENLIITKQGKRACRICVRAEGRENQRRYRAARKAGS